MINRYKNFMFLSILESILQVDPEFISLIKEIASEDDYVAKSLIKLIGDDIKTNINYIKPSDKNDDIKFVNDTQVQRILDAGGDPFEKSLNTTKIGRSVRQLLKFNNISFTDVQIENFVNLYKNAWDNKFSKLSEGFSLVKGSNIKKWYLEANYVPGGGQLNNSCMRQEHKQDFFEIYIQNPEVCQLLILLDDRGLLLGRALLWKLIPGTGKSDYYLDRIYTRFDNDVDKFKRWYIDFLNEPDEFSSYFSSDARGVRVQLKNWKFEEYPYMDTFEALGYESGILKTRRERNEPEYYIQYTDGSYTVPDYYWSKNKKSYLHSSESVYVDDDYYLKSDCELINTGNYILKKDAIYSDYYGTYIDKRYSIEIEDLGLVDRRDVIEVYDEMDKDGNLLKFRTAIKNVERDNFVFVQFGASTIALDKKLAIYDIEQDEYVINHPKYIGDGLLVFNVIGDSVLDKIKQVLNINYENRIYFVKNNLNIFESKIPLCVYYSGRDLISELTFKSLELNEDDISERVLVSKRGYYNAHKYVINYKLDKQVEILPNKEAKLRELETIIPNINDEIFISNNELFKEFIDSKFDNITDLLSEKIAKIWNKNLMLNKLYNETNVLNYIKNNRVDARYKLDNEFIMINSETSTNEFVNFIKDYEYYILLYCYIYFLNRGRDKSFPIIKSLLPKDGKDLPNDSIIELFTYSDTGGRFGATLNDSDLKIGIIGDFISENFNSGTSDSVYIETFNVFYKNLKQDNK